jgi:L-aspartate oxidase
MPVTDITAKSWDVIIVGSGLAGLYTALQLADKQLDVLLITKGDVSESNTQEAQGGIAASISEQDSPRLHMEDTLIAGDGLCRPTIVQGVVEAGPAGIRHLLNLGVSFDQSCDGSLALTREGAHSRRRILHAQGDSTGKVIQEALTRQVRERANIQVEEHLFALDIITDHEGCLGLTCLSSQGVIALRAAHVVIASGGACQLYRNNTNPAVATGDGIAMAWRAGAVLADMEFVQFHPTALLLPGAPRFLISEAVRGEGARLLNAQGDRFMPSYHSQGELAPRDVVSRAIVKELHKTRSDIVWLDLSPIRKDIQERFPTIFRRCFEYGLNLPDDLVPVAPAAHYFIGGIVTDENGATSIPGVFACGECTCTGVHGANRLASNSLLEALVFGERIAQTIAQGPPRKCQGEIPVPTEYRRPSFNRQELQDLMWRHAGLERSRVDLEQALHQLREWVQDFKSVNAVTFTQQEDVNLLTLAGLLVRGALLREESRGGHCRLDYPARRGDFQGHIYHKLGEDAFFTALEEGK